MHLLLALALLTASSSVHARPQQQTTTAFSSQSQSTSSASRSAIDLSDATTITDFTAAVPTGTYLTYNSQITLSNVNTANGQTNASATSHNSVLSGIVRTSTLGSNGTSTSSTAAATNTQKCNGYVEFCERQYLNVTEVCAHNSAFFVKNNVASNQQYDITSQLNDGIRMIQGETHWVNDTLYACHTSCDLLNAGTLQNELETVANWVSQHPYDVVTILLVNSDYRNVTDYVTPIQNSGLAEYLYEPPKIPMHRSDWPTYAEMIISSKRVVMFMDYQADQTEVPYILDEFTQMWETPFSPTNASFPCTQQRPPNLSQDDARDMPYLANHNLNVQIDFGSLEILIPSYSSLSSENAVSGFSSAGEMMDVCVESWGRPPSFLLVDYYNYGNWSGSGRSSNDSGSVFEVAARLNGVNYTASCCGTTSANAGTSLQPNTYLAAGFMVAVALMLST